MEGLSIGPIGSFEDLRQLAIGMVRYWPFPCDLAGPPECAPNLDFLVACRAIGPLFAAERLDRGLTAEECRAVVENVLASFRARAREGT